MLDGSFDPEILNEVRQIIKAEPTVRSLRYTMSIFWIRAWSSTLFGQTKHMKTRIRVRE